MLHKNRNIYVFTTDNRFSSEWEIVERKGKGHPDTLADGLAETLSIAYSQYTIEHFGAVLHHNFDKVGLLGGRSLVKFGEGHLTHPIRVLINGRASENFGNEEIPVKKLLTETAHRFFIGFFPTLNPARDLDIHLNLSVASSPGFVENGEKDHTGARKYWFSPRGFCDLPEISRLFSNDTSLGCSYAPLSQTEKAVIYIENTLNSPSYQKERPWIGSDIKIMAFRSGKNLDMTVAIPQVASYVSSLEAYKNNIESARQDINMLIKNHFPELQVSLFVNTRDDYEKNEIYLTAIGSSIESGDEGLVGRGNRANGLITPCRPMSIEAACGKNPVYHVGKLYNVAANILAERIYELTGTEVEVFLISQSGCSLKNPWKTVVILHNVYENVNSVQKLVQECLEDVPSITSKILKEELEIWF